MTRKVKKKKDKKKNLEFIRLGWEILHHKFAYYEGPKHGIKPIPDSEYDKIEYRYRELAKELGEKPRAADLVGFDYEEGRGVKGMIAQNMIATGGKIPMRRATVKEQAKKARKKTNVFMKTLREVLEEIDVDEKTAKKIRLKMKKRFKV